MICNYLIHRFPSESNRASQVKTLLSGLEFYVTWWNQSIGDISLFISLFEQCFLSLLTDKPKRTLEWFGWSFILSNCNNFPLKSYLDLVKIYNMRRPLTWFRDLEIGAGRWTKPVSVPVAERSYSTFHMLEDKFPVFLTCKEYNSRVYYVIFCIRLNLY